MERKLTFAQACACYVHRYTMEHIPQWVRADNAKPTRVRESGNTLPGYYAPQFRSDRELYEHTIFPDEPGYLFAWRTRDCYTHSQTWPLGVFLKEPYELGKSYDAQLDAVRTAMEQS